MERMRSVTAFFALVLALSLPFWLVGPVFDRLLHIPLQLPVSALMAVVPGLAAVILVARAGGAQGLRIWWVGMARRPPARWVAAAVVLEAAVVLGAWVVPQRMGLTPPGLEPTPAAAALVLAPVFLVSAFTEEVGWQGFAAPRLTPRLGALGAALLIGAVWGLWHVAPFLQAGRSAEWIAWQVAHSLALRLVLFQLWARSGSIWPAVPAHAAYNLCVFLLPGYGAAYDPAATTLTTAAAAAVLWAWPCRRAP